MSTSNQLHLEATLYALAIAEMLSTFDLSYSVLTSPTEMVFCGETGNEARIAFQRKYQSCPIQPDHQL
jgi:hypothetical protein